jgi:hypothetical protein
MAMQENKEVSSYYLWFFLYYFLPTFDKMKSREKLAGGTK